MYLMKLQEPCLYWICDIHVIAFAYYVEMGGNLMFDIASCNV